MSDDTITNRMLLEEIQGVKKHVRGVKEELNDLRQDMNQRFEKVDQRFEEINKHLTKHDLAFQRLYEKRTQLAEDVRMMKEEDLPEIREHVGLAA